MISVVIPIYNGKDFLEECLRSVLTQSRRDLEVIVSDDHSGDGSYELALSMAREDGRLKVIQNETGKRGIFENLNNAIDHSSGRYIQIFNQDDVMQPDMLETQAACLDAHPDAGMVFCRKINIDEHGNDIGLTKDELYKPLLPDVLPHEIAYQYFVAYGCIPGNLSPVMMTRVCRDAVGPFNAEFHYAGDFEYWIRISRRFDLVFNRAFAVRVRKHGNRASQVLAKRDMLLTKQTFELYEALLAGYVDKAERQAAITHVQRTVGAYKFHVLIRFLLAGRFAEVRKTAPLFKGIFGVSGLWFKYLQLKLFGREPKGTPIFVKQG